MNFHEMIGRACCNPKFREALAEHGAAGIGGGATLADSEQAFFEQLRNRASPEATVVLKAMEAIQPLAHKACRTAPDC